MLRWSLYKAILEPNQLYGSTKLPVGWLFFRFPHRWLNVTEWNYYRFDTLSSWYPTWTDCITEKTLSKR